MKSFLSLKKYIGGVFLFFFLFSANALLYSSHFVAEFGHDDHSVTSQSGDSDSSISSTMVVENHHHDEGRAANHEDGNSCCDSHSHVSILYQPISYTHSPRLSTHLTGEPFRFIPEVYLDKFIPPQNLA